MSDQLFTNRGCRIRVKAGVYSIAVSVDTTSTERTVLRLDASSAMALASMLAEAAEDMTRAQEHKYCPQCHTVKAVCEFYGDRTRPDKLSAYCKPCKLALNRPTSRAWYWKHKAQQAKEQAA